jgi:hypothetical protein
MLAINTTTIQPSNGCLRTSQQIMGNPKYVALAGVLMIGEKGIKNDLPNSLYTNGQERLLRTSVCSMDWQ